MSVDAPQAVLFGETADSTAIEVFTLKNSHGVILRAMTYGAIVLSIETPDRAGNLADIVLGYTTVDEYFKDTSYLGAVIGRFGNRIANGKFSLDGKDYRLAINNDPAGIKCALHGGLKGFDKVVWRAEGLARNDAQGVRFSYFSEDGEEGYPGNLHISVTYWLTEKNEWWLDYEMMTDNATPVNVTQHSYFNLKGEGVGNILDHELMLVASRFTPVTAGLIPTGELRSVSGTALDFTTSTVIGARIESDDEQIHFGAGYDHNWVLDSQDHSLALAASVYESSTGRTLEVLTTEPGVQFYSGNFLNDQQIGKSGRKYERRSGFCLETQHFPDSPNQLHFPTTILKPGEVKKTTTVFRFGSR
jgi:aldose 1-epimerase